TDSVSIVPGPDYAAGSFHRFFWGDHYRDVWTTEIRVPVLDLETYAGGLTPLSAGGGYQTKSLWLRGADGKIHAFRSVYKYATELVPEVLRDTYVEDLLQDQMSTQYPFAPLIVDRLAEAAGVLQSTPNLYVLPDDESLGEFQEVFGGILGMLAERPDENENALAAFLGASEVIDGFEVIGRVQADPTRRVDSRAFLTARLIDVLVGDWDRHTDQWRWTRFPSDSPPGWRPIPSDRDQAFARLDGFILSLGRPRFPMLTSFREEYDDVSRFHYQARFIDRLFLTELEREVWDSTAATLAARLSDEVIERAVDRLPAEVRAASGPFLQSALERRRDNLPGIASELYALLAREPYVHGSDVSEVAEVAGRPRGVEITIRRSAEGSEPYWRRTFLAAETKEVRLYLHGGDDRTVIQAPGKLPIKIRIIGGEGDDEYHFQSETGNVQLYDQHGRNVVSGLANGARINNKSYPPPALVPESGTAPPPRHWGRFGYPMATGGYNPDVGLVVGGSYTWFDYGFRKDPYASRLEVSAAAATRLKGALRVAGDFRFENSPLYLALDLGGSSLETVNFFGIGNDTERIDDQPNDYYDVENTRVEGQATIGADLGRLVNLGVGLAGGFSNTKDDPDTFLGQNPDTYGAGQFGWAGAVGHFDLTTSQPGYLIETTGGPRAAVRLEAAFYPEFIDVDSTYGWLDAVGAASLPLGVRRWEVGVRVGGRKVWGEAPWFQLAFIGGGNSLRGWQAQRFAGDASLFGGAELRLDLFDYRLVFPSTFGILGLIDAGRVWVDGESPGDWHTGYGGGIWLALRGTRSIVSAAYAESDEDSGVYITLGFQF
ncbi:MAG: hypothetical protein PVJ43_15810, partial [Gemmatimonadales bacterium]